VHKKAPPLREQLHQARPDLAERQAKNVRKRAIAIKLRTLRDARGQTQVEVAEAAGMTQAMIARLEALSGPLPSLESIERYVDACGGEMALLISPTTTELPDIAVKFHQFHGRLPSGERTSGDKFSDGFVRSRGRIPADLDLGFEPRQSLRDTKTKT
jgi:transcriptional regulator with XRE-family HTH domain